MLKLLLISLILLPVSTPFCAAKPLQLNVEGKSCKAYLFTNQADKARGGLIIVSDHSSPLNFWLAQGLTQYGWSSLSIQLTLKCGIQQIPAAIRYLRQKKLRRIIALYYGDGLSAFLQYFLKPKTKKVNGIVLLSAFDRSSKPKQAPLLQQWTTATYDIIAQFDYAPAISQWNSRKESIKASYYTGLQLTGAEHDYADSKAALINWVSGWMKKQRQSPLKKPPLSLKKRKQR